MKKLILCILTATLLTSITGPVFAYENPSQATEHRLIAAEETTPETTSLYVPAITPKPSTLPGPTVNQTGTKTNAREILSGKLLPKITTGMIGFVAMLSFVMLVISGVRFVVAYGNEEALGKAKTQATYAIVGLILALLSFSIVTIISNIEIVQ